MTSWSEPTLDEVQRAVALLTHKQQRRYFFNNLENPLWIEPLYDQGFFQQPPEPFKDDEGGGLRHPIWPESRYLAQMAEHAEAADAVLRILLALPRTDNVTVLDDIAQAALELPPTHRRQVVIRLERWLNEHAFRGYWGLYERLADVSVRVAVDGNVNEGLRLVQRILSFSPPPETDDAFALRPDPQPRMNIHEYERILEESIPRLVRAAGLQALDLLCVLLNAALRVRAPRDGPGAPHDASPIWWPHVSRDKEHVRHLHEALAAAIRDSAKLLVAENLAPLGDVRAALKEQRWTVFMRIGLHLLVEFPDQGRDEALELLQDGALTTTDLRYEFATILQSYYPDAPNPVRAAVHSWIRAGPKDVDEYREFVEQRRPGQANELVESYIATWKRDWGGLIVDYLPDDLAQEIRTLIEETGDPQPILAVRSSAGFIGPRSPISSDELLHKPPAEIVDFLDSWVPEDREFDAILPWQSFQGLARTLEGAVRSDVERFAEHWQAFKELPGVFVGAVLDGMREALKEGTGVVVEPALELASELTERTDPETWNGEREKVSRTHLRKIVLRSVGVMLDATDAGVPLEHRDRIWGILERCTRDPDPSRQEEDEWTMTTRSPHDLSINTVRGSAVEAVIRYALWVVRQERGDLEATTFAIAPEAAEVLAWHLDPENDPTVAVRSTYGVWFPWLHLVDPEWTTERTESIFPRAANQEYLWVGAWRSYITLRRPYDSVFEVMRPQYTRAVERLATERGEENYLTEYEQNLAHHLMAYYWRGLVQLDDQDQLLPTFFENADPDLRKHTIRFIGVALGNSDMVEDETLNRLRRLWEWRVDVCLPPAEGGDADELGGFVTWLDAGVFDSSWALDQVRVVIENTSLGHAEHIVVEALLDLVDEEPERVARVFQALVEQRGRPGIYIWDDEAKELLPKLGASENVAAVELAHGIYDTLLSRGAFQFKGILADRG